jgi:hypothetical protein
MWVTFVNVVDKSTHADMVCRLVEYFGLLQGNLLDGNCSEISNITVQPALSGFLLSHARGKLLIMVELYYTWFLHRNCGSILCRQTSFAFFFFVLVVEQRNWETIRKIQQILSGIVS